MLKLGIDPADSVHRGTVHPSHQSRHMQDATRGGRFLCRVESLILAGCVAVSITACGGGSGGGNSDGYHQVDLMCFKPGGCTRGATFSPAVRNAWGVVDQGGIAVAGNREGVASCYLDEGQPRPIDPCLAVIPLTAQNTSSHASPTGIVFNNGSEFVIGHGAKPAPAAALVATEEGTIAGINLSVDEQFAVVAIDNSSTNARYTGLALGGEQNRFLYVANFQNASVDVFDGTFAAVTPRGRFVDADIPADFAPFGIQNLAGEIFVTYAKQGDGGTTDLAGDGNGYVSVFDSDGNFLRRFASRGPLNSPWGIARAPVGFGRFGGAIIIANHGDGRFNAFDSSGTLQGQLETPGGKPVVIEGLWGVAGAEPTANVPAALYFTAGPHSGDNGLFGRLEPSS
jgi:uncharacterized protein (TIGR03118 family)